jgi:hypothetical protein
LSALALLFIAPDVSSVVRNDSSLRPLLPT